MFAPLMADQSHGWHNIQIVAAQMRRHPIGFARRAELRVSGFVLRPQAVHDESEIPVFGTLLLVGAVSLDQAVGR